MLARYHWLDAPQGRVVIGAAKVLIGRSPDCTIVLEGPEVSRYHALVRRSEAGAELVPLGREPVRINGVERRTLTALAAGDTVEVCGWRFSVGEGEMEQDASVSPEVWCLEGVTGLLHFVTGADYAVGGGLQDDLILVGWAPGVFAIDATQAPPVLTAHRPGLWCERDCAVGERVALADGMVIRHRTETLTVRSRQASAGGETRPSSEVATAAVRATLEFQPRGGRLTLEMGGKVCVTELSDRRCDLVACLLQPPAPFQPGDLIPEDTLCARVWPGEKNGRTELNSLLYRLRQALSSEGLDPSSLFERRGGGLRICLAPGARVVVG